MDKKTKIKVEDYMRIHSIDVTQNNIEYYSKIGEYFEKSHGTVVEKLENFSKYVPRQMLTRFLAKYELFKRILSIHGSIIECGVFHGGGMMSFAQFSAIFEPVNHQRRIIGFDTFEGFKSISKVDYQTSTDLSQTYEGGLRANSYEDLKECSELYDLNRFLGHINKIELVKGDACITIPKYVKDNPHLVISLLYLDIDLFEPTKVALQNFLPRIPKGGIIAFDELNASNFPGETMAVLEEIGISNLKIERLPFDSCMSFAVVD